MKTSFIPIYYDYFDFEGKNYVRIIGRNEFGKRVCIIDSCDVYLWAILKNNVSKKDIEKLKLEISKIKVKLKERVTKVEKVELYNKKFLDKDVKALKIFATNYKDLHDIADRLKLAGIEKRRGYDLGFVTHYINEKKVEPLDSYEVTGQEISDSVKFGGMAKILNVDLCIIAESIKKTEEKKFSPKTLSFDIETNDLKIGAGQILMVSLVSENFKKVISWKTIEKKPDFVEYVKNEKELLEKFVETVKNISPDFLVGYFSDGFDLPYLKERAKKLKIPLNLGLDNSQPKFSRGAILTGKVMGISHIDILRFIKTAYGQYMKSETFSLNDVASEFLDEKKVHFELPHSTKTKEENWLNFFHYNLHDSTLTQKLFEKFFPDLIEFTKITKEPPFDISRAGISKLLENYILHNLEKFSEIPEKKPIYEEISKRKESGPVEGAFVLEPKPGLYQNIVMFDFTSMHTSIIISLNLSKGTILEKEEKNSRSIETEKGKFYFSKKPGFLPELFKELFEKRTKFKKEYKKNPTTITQARSNAFKVLSAAAHGYIAFFGSRYYSKETSRAILSSVRKFQKDIMQKVKLQGYVVIFGDTDSVGFVRGKSSKKEILAFLEKLNKNLPGIMRLELENFYLRGIWVTTRSGKTGAKKKYALISEKGELKIRGFETVRRDWCTLARTLQNKVLFEILKTGNEKSALDYTKEIIKKIKKREIKKESLIIKSQLRKPLKDYKAITPHVIAARKMQEKEIPVSQGELIQYYISQTKDKKKLIRDRVKLPIEDFPYDVGYYLNNQLLPSVENIFQVFNVKVKEIIDGKKQATLEFL